MSAYKVGDYVVNHAYSVGIISKVTDLSYFGEWYSGGEHSSSMNCPHSIAHRYAEHSDIVGNVPSNEMEDALRWLNDRKQKEAEELTMTTATTVVTVTSEEKKALDICKEYHGSKSLIEFAAWYCEQHTKWVDDYAPLRKMGVKKFLEAITGTYEVEVVVPTFNIGDHVVYIGDSSGFKGVGVIDSANICTYNVRVGKSCTAIRNQNIRLATEEEIKICAMWSALGRKDGEFHIGDRVMTDSGNLTEIYGTWSLDIAKARYGRGEIIGFYPATSYVAFTEGGKA